LPRTDTLAQDGPADASDPDAPGAREKGQRLISVHKPPASGSSSKIIGNCMGYLRLIHSAPPVPTPENACLDAFERELDYIFATLQRLGAAPGDVEDLAQEVFVVLHRNWPTLDTGRTLRPYLFAIAFRILCAHRRRWAREIPCPEVDANDASAGPEASLQSKQSIALLSAALADIPLSRRAVIVMHDLDEVPIVEVARTLSITRFGAYARLRKGRKELAAAVRRLSKGGARK
jgi:RNA polymerase sigma-70 factor (ECF subfamily)